MRLPALAVLLCASPAAADFQQALPTNLTAHTLRAGEWQIGLAHVGYAPVANVEVSTLYWAWLGLAPNLRVKWSPWRNEDLAVSLAAGMYYWSLAPFQALLKGAGLRLPDLQLLGGPVEAAASVTLRENLSMHCTAVWEWGLNLQSIPGSPTPPELFTQSALFRTDVLWAFQPENAMYATWRFPLYSAQQQGGGTLYQDKVGDMQLIIGYHYSGPIFNLRIGAGIGRSAFSPGSPGPVFDLDLYWRLGAT